MEGGEVKTDGCFAVIGVTMFFENPYLPDQKVRLCVVDRRMSRAKLSALKAKKIDYIFAWQHNNVLHGIDTHPDMTLCPLGGKYLVAEPQSYAYYEKMLAPFGFCVIKGETVLRKEYPHDIAYNALIFNHTLFGHLNDTDPAILAFAKKAGYSLVNTAQGYTKCAVYPVAENAVITQDKGLEKVFLARGIDVLCLKESEVALIGFPDGFIGGAGGKIDRFHAAFFGDINQQKEFETIKMFLERYAVTPQSLSREALQDHGSLLPLLG